MKYSGYFSLLIGVFGVYSIADWSNRAEKAYIEAQQYEGFMHLEAVPLIPYELLIISQVFGISLGVISVRKKLNKKISSTGIAICLICLGFLFYLR